MPEHGGRPVKALNPGLTRPAECEADYHASAPDGTGVVLRPAGHQIREGGT